MKLLLVDDDPDIIVIATLSLQFGGFEIASCKGGQAALEFLSKNTVDGVILDVLMPDLKGPQVLQRLEEGHPPVIFLTAQTQDHELLALYNSKAIGVIIKPFDPLTLANQVRAMLNKRPLL